MTNSSWKCCKINMLIFCEIISFFEKGRFKEMYWFGIWDWTDKFNPELIDTEINKGKVVHAEGCLSEKLID